MGLGCELIVTVEGREPILAFPCGRGVRGNALVPPTFSGGKDSGGTLDWVVAIRPISEFRGLRVQEDRALFMAM